MDQSDTYVVCIVNVMFSRWVPYLREVKNRCIRGTDILYYVDNVISPYWGPIDWDGTRFLNLGFRKE